jgi:diphthine methyl ester synthase
VYQPPRYMLTPQLITQLLEADLHHQTGYLPAHDTLAIALCRMGCGNAATASEGQVGPSSDDELIVAGTLHELLSLAAASPEVLAQEEAADDEQFPDASEAQLDQRRASRAEQRAIKAFGGPLHSLVIVGKRLHPLERDYAGQYAVPDSRWFSVAKDTYGCV